MFPILLVIFYLCASISQCAKPPIDPETLQAVFGNQQNYEKFQARPAGKNVSAIQTGVSSALSNGTQMSTDYSEGLDDFKPTSADYDKFDWTLTKRIAASTEQNFLLSPLGLKLALAILTEAATGSTKSELSSVLGFDEDKQVVRTKFSAILHSLQMKSDRYILDLGSRVYIDHSIEPSQQFAAAAEEFYMTELKTVGFNDSKSASAAINSWVSNITHGRIPDLVKENDIENNVMLILTTLYFKGVWRHQFAPNVTRMGPFYVSPNVTKQAPFMNLKAQFYLTDSKKFDAKILRLPYAGNKFSMYVIVPNSLTGIGRVLDGLHELSAEMAVLQECIVDLTLPRFKFDYTSALDQTLRELGIRQAFEDTASFPGVARGQQVQRRLKVSRVLQRAGIELNERGSVAYSATEITLENKFGEDSSDCQEVVANKPFLFFIEDEASRQVLFTGRVADPSLPDGALKLTAHKS